MERPGSLEAVGQHRPALRSLAKSCAAGGIGSSYLNCARPCAPMCPAANCSRWTWPAVPSSYVAEVLDVAGTEEVGGGPARPQAEPGEPGGRVRREAPKARSHNVGEARGRRHACPAVGADAGARAAELSVGARECPRVTAEPRGDPHAHRVNAPRRMFSRWPGLCIQPHDPTARPPGRCPRPGSRPTSSAWRIARVQRAVLGPEAGSGVSWGRTGAPPCPRVALSGGSSRVLVLEPGQASWARPRCAGRE